MGLLNVGLLIGSVVLMGIGMRTFKVSTDFKQQTTNKESKTVASQGILFGLGLLFLGIGMFVLAVAFKFN